MKKPFVKRANAWYYTMNRGRSRDASLNESSYVAKSRIVLPLQTTNFLLSKSKSRLDPFVFVLECK